jgi:hypothetical protein
LTIPSSARVVQFVDKPSGWIGEDLIARAEFDLSPTELEPLIDQAHALGYSFVDSSRESVIDVGRRLGVGQFALPELSVQLRLGCKGLFRYVSEGEGAYSLVVLDITHHRVVVEVEIL